MQLPISSTNNMKPIIKVISKQICAFCPCCGEVVYEAEDRPNAEIACNIAFGRHIPNCKNRPDYTENDMDKLRNAILGS